VSPLTMVTMKASTVVEDVSSSPSPSDGGIASQQSCSCDFPHCQFPLYSFGVARDGRIVEIPRGSREDHLSAALKKVYHVVGLFILRMEDAGPEGHRCYECFDLFYDRVMFVEHLRDHSKRVEEEYLDLLDARQSCSGKLFLYF
jgi:hypothetical protein